MSLGTGAMIGGGSLYYVSKKNDSHPYRVRFSGTVETEEPIVRNTGVQTEEGYPFQYATLINTADIAERLYQTTYLQEEVNLDVSDYIRADYGTEFHVIVGVKIPNALQLNSKGLKLEDRVLYANYSITRNNNASDGLVIHNSVQRLDQRGHPAPERIVPRYQIKDGFNR